MKSAALVHTLICTVVTCRSANCPVESQSGRDLTEAGNKLYSAGKLEAAVPAGWR